jgi:hypothetical protein
VFREVIFSSKIFSTGDVLINYFPYYNALFRAPDIIMQSIISGFPVYLSVSTTWFNPINKLLFHFFDSFDAFRFLDVAYLVGAYVFTYLFSKRIGLSHYASIAVGLIYIFSGQVMLWSETIIMTSYYFLLPLVLYSLNIAFSRKNWSRWTLFGVSGVLLGVGWLAGHVQFVIYIHTLVFVYLMFQTSKESSWREGRYWVTLFSICIFIFGISFLIGYPMISALLGFLQVTARIGGVTLDMAWANSYMPYHLIHYFLPNFAVPYPVVPYQNAFQNYIGILPFMLLVFGLYQWKKIVNFKTEVGFFLNTGLFCLLASMRYSPVIFLFHYLPFFKTFRESPRIMFIGDFALAIFMGFVIDYIVFHHDLVSEQLDRFLKMVRSVFMWFILPMVAVFSFVYVFFFARIEEFSRGYFITHIYPHTVAGLPKEHYFNLIHSYLTIFIGQFSIFSKDVFVLVVFGVLSYLLLKNKNKLSQQNFMLLVILIIALNFVLLYANRIHGISRADYMGPSASANLILARGKGGEQFRIFSPFNDVSIFNESTRCNFPQTDGWEMSKQEFLLRKELLETNLNMVYGIDSADGYEPYESNRLIGLMEYIGSRFAGENTHGMRLMSENISIDEKVNKFAERKNILRSMNVKYVLSYFQINDSDFKEVAFEKVGDCGSPVHIYELSGTWPRYFTTNNVKTIGDKTDIYKSHMFTLASTTKPTIILEDATSTPNQVDRSINGFEVVRPTIGSDSMKFSIENKRANYLFVGNTWLPNWQATIDGKSTQIIKINYIYMALSVPAGKHEIVFSYKQ